MTCVFLIVNAFKCDYIVSCKLSKMCDIVWAIKKPVDTTFNVSTGLFFLFISVCVCDSPQGHGHFKAQCNECQGHCHVISM